MGTGTFVLLAIAGIGALVGWIMLVVAAFRQSALWGVGTLLLGPVQLAFAIVHWREAKVGFLVQVVCGVIMGAVLGSAIEDELELALAAAAAEQQMVEVQAHADSTTPSAFVEASYEAGDDQEDAATASAAPAPAPAARIRYAYQDVTLGELAGKNRGKIEVHTKNGQRHTGELVVAGTNRIELRKRMQGGSFNFRIQANDIESLRLWGQVQS